MDLNVSFKRAEVKLVAFLEFDRADVAPVESINEVSGRFVGVPELRDDLRIKGSVLGN